MSRSRPGWFDVREESVARRIVLAPLDVLSWLYAGVAWIHRQLWARGLRRPRRLACRVVSVGNLTVGGTGKTPAAAWLARELRRRGHKVVLASRGYGRRDREPVRVVSDGRHVQARGDQAGDEPLLLAAHAPGVPVLVARDRGVAALRGIAAFGAETVVLDDGFQHHRLAHDVEIVCFDGAGGLGNGRVLPRGPLREPIGALRHAHAVLVVDGPLQPEDATRVGAHAPSARWFSARREARGVRPLAGGALEPPETLRGRELGLLAGIARPESFRRSLEVLGAKPVAERCFRDHHRYRRYDLEGLASQAPLWITTEKDAVKILPEWLPEGTDLRVLVMELAPEEPQQLLDWLEERLRAARR